MLLKSHSAKFLLSVGILLFSAPAKAFISLGIKGGLGYSSVASTPDQSRADRSQGALGGVSLDIGAGIVSFVVDALYAQRAYKLDTGDVTLNSLHLPAQIKFSLVPGLFTSAGGYYSLGLGNNDFEDHSIKSTDYGAVVGVGASVPLGMWAATVEIRYNIGIANVLEGGTDTNSIKNRQLDLLLGLRF